MKKIESFFVSLCKKLFSLCANLNILNLCASIMSNLFSRLNVISQSQHDAEIDSPPIARCPASLFARAPNMTTIPDDDPEESSSVLTVPTNSDCWVSCHTKEQVEDFQDQLERMKQKQRHKNVTTMMIVRRAWRIT